MGGCEGGGEGEGETYAIRGLGKAHGGGSGSDGLDLGGEEFDADGPCCV